MADELQSLRAAAAGFGRFNLLAFDGRDMFDLGNHPQVRLQAISRGTHVLSNASLDTEWPKTRRLRAALEQWIGTGDDDPAPLFDGLADPQIAADTELPGTGVPLEWERRLSAAFISGSEYGTRASSVVLVGDEHTRFIERRFGPNGVALGESDQLIEHR